MPAVLVTGPTVTQDSPFSSLAVAVTIASTHFAYLRRDDQAELAWVAWLNTKMVYPRTVTHLSINPARHRVTSLMCPTMLPLSQTATARDEMASSVLPGLLAYWPSWLIKVPTVNWASHPANLWCMYARLILFNSRQLKSPISEWSPTLLTQVCAKSSSSSSSASVY